MHVPPVRLWSPAPEMRRLNPRGPRRMIALREMTRFYSHYQFGAKRCQSGSGRKIACPAFRPGTGRHRYCADQRPTSDHRKTQQTVDRDRKQNSSLPTWIAVLPRLSQRAVRSRKVGISYAGVMSAAQRRRLVPKDRIHQPDWRGIDGMANITYCFIEHRSGNPT